MEGRLVTYTRSNGEEGLNQRLALFESMLTPKLLRPQCAQVHTYLTAPFQRKTRDKEEIPDTPLTVSHKDSQV